MLYVCMGHVALFLVLSGPKWWPLEYCTRRWGIMLASITFHTKNTSHLKAIQAISSMLFMHVLYAKWMIKHVGCPGTDLICSTWRLTPPKSLRDRSLLVPVPQKLIAALGWFWNVMKLPGLVSTYKTDGKIHHFHPCYLNVKIHDFDWARASRSQTVDITRGYCTWVFPSVHHQFIMFLGAGEDPSDCGHFLEGQLLYILGHRILGVPSAGTSSELSLERARVPREYSIQHTFIIVIF